MDKCYYRGFLQIFRRFNANLNLCIELHECDVQIHDNKPTSCLTFKPHNVMNLTTISSRMRLHGNFLLQ